jgi:HSP20 family protein
MALKSLIPWKREDRSLMGRAGSNPIESLHRQIDRMFEDVFTGARTSLLDRSWGAFAPEVDVTETKDAVKVEAELPGLDEKDVDVSVADGALTIKGEKRQEHEEERGDYWYAERSFGTFQRVIPLPEGVDFDKARATFKKGVLKVELPKTADAASRRNRIPVNVE